MISYPNLGAIKNWQTSYNPYIDIFQIFDERVFNLPSNEVHKDNIGEAVVLCDSISDKALLIELKNAYTYIGNVDKMSKDEIYHNIKRYIDNYDRTNRSATT